MVRLVEFATPFSLTYILKEGKKFKVVNAIYKENRPITINCASLDTAFIMYEHFLKHSIM